MILYIKNCFLLFMMTSLLMGLFSQTLSAQITINEIIADPGNYDGQGAEWAELYNAGTSAVDLSCYILTDGEEIILFPSGTSIPAGGYLLIYNSNFFNCPTCNWDPAISALIDADGSDGTSSIDLATCGCTNQSASSCYAVTWDNGGNTDRVVLFDPDAAIVDAVYWGNGASEAPAASPIPEGDYSQGPLTTGTGGDIIGGGTTGCNLPASNNYTVPALPAPATSDATWEYIGPDNTGCTTSYGRLANGAGSGLADWMSDLWPTPGQSNTIANYGITYALNGGSAVNFTTSDAVTLNVCSGAILAFSADINAFNQVFNDADGDVGNAVTLGGGSLINATGGLVLTNQAWTEAAITAGGVTNLSYTTAAITANTTITLKIKENTQASIVNPNSSGCAGAGANIGGSGAASECYISKTITVNVIPTLTAVNLTCNNGNISVATTPSNIPGLTYQLLNNGVPVPGQSNSTGTFIVTTAPTAPGNYTVQVTSAAGCGGPLVTNSTACFQTKPCPSFAANAACPTTPSGSVCPGANIQLGVSVTNPPLNGTIEWVSLANAADDPYTQAVAVLASYTSKWAATGFTSTPDGAAIYRSANGTGGWTNPISTATNTPGTSNGGVYTGTPVLNEVRYDGPDGPSAGGCDGSSLTNRAGEYIEIAGAPGTDLSCYKITDGDWTITIPSGTTIPLDGVFLIGNSLNTCDGASMSLDLDLASTGSCPSCFFSGGPAGDFTLTNESGTNGEFVALFDPTGTMLDGVIWGPINPATFSTASNHPCGHSGTVNPPDPAGCTAVSSLTIPKPLECSCIAYTIPSNTCDSTINIAPRIQPIITGCTPGTPTPVIAPATTYTVPPCPTATLSGETAICSGATASMPVTITDAPAACTNATITYTIDGGAPIVTAALPITGGVATVTGLATAGNYVITNVAFSGAGCTTCSATLSGSFVVTVANNPAAPTASAQEACNGQPTTLTASGADNLIWYSNVGLTTQIGTGSTYNYTGASNTTLYVQSVNPDTGCKSTGTSVAITVNPLPTAAIAPTNVCVGSPLLLTGTAGAGTPNYTYTWTTSSINNYTSTSAATAATTNTVTVTGSAIATDAGDYFVRVKDSKNCYARASQAVGLLNTPIFTAVAVCTTDGTTPAPEGVYYIEVTVTDLGDDTDADNQVTITDGTNTLANLGLGTYYLGPISHSGTGTATPTITVTNDGETCGASTVVSEAVCGIPQAQASCDCTIPDPNGRILAQVAPGSFDPAVSEMVYVLTDAAGTILASNQTGLFENLVNADYEVHAYNFTIGSVPSPLPTSGLLSTWEAGLPPGSCFAACAAWPFTVACDCCIADAGNIVIPTDIGTISDGNTITICQGTDVNAFVVTYAQPDEADPGTLGVGNGYDLRYILADATGEILQYNATGNFNTAGLTSGTYDVFVLSYKESTNLFSNIDTYLALIDITYAGGDIAAIVADDTDNSSYGLSQGSTPIPDPATFGTFCLDLDQLDNDGLDGVSEKVQIVINALPVCTIGGTLTVCPNAAGLVYTAAAGMATYAWSISGNGTITSAANGANVTVTAGATCGTPFTLSVTITDVSGCTSSCLQPVAVNDATPPTIQNCAAIGAAGPVQLACNTPPTSDMALAAMGTIADSDCGLAAGSPTVTPGAITGACNKTQTFTVTATNLCGATTSCSISYTWTDDIVAPTFALCTDGNTANNTISLGCNPSPPTAGMAITAAGTITEGCGLGTNTPNASVTTPASTVGCVTTETWTVSVTDACANTGTCSVTYTWTTDTTAPTFALCADGDPTNNTISLGCNPAVLPTSASVVTAAGAVTEGCGLGTNTPIAVVNSTTVSGCLTTQVWTVSVADACGNIGTCQLTYTWTNDAVAPTFALCTDGNPANNTINLGCNPLPAAMPTAAMAITAAGSVTEGCGLGGNVPSAAGGAITVVGCVSSQVWTVSVTDACGNIGSCQVTYTWTTDAVAPTFALCTDGDAANNTISLGCNPSLPTAGMAITAAGTITEGCGLGTNTPSASITTPASTVGCVTTETWTVSVTDACGNTGTCSVTYTWTTDTTAPTFALCADGDPTNNTISLGCNPAVLPTSASVVTAAGAVTEGCGLGTNTPIAVVNSTTVSGCLTTQVWTVSVADACGNIGTCQLTYTWTNDAVAPTFALCTDGNPANNTISLGCNPVGLPTEIMAITAAGSVTEGCGLGGNVPSAVGGAITVVGCVSSQVWTVSVTDACGNIGSCQVTYTWTTDAVAPTFALCTDGNTTNNTISLGCILSPPTAIMAIAAAGTITESCGLGTNTPSASITTTSTVGCVTTETWTISVTDLCGNIGTCAVTYIYTIDATPPTFVVCPPNLVLTCDGNYTTEINNWLATASATDACGVTVTNNLTAAAIAGLTCDAGSVTVVFTATDACGNTATCSSQVIFTQTPSIQLYKYISSVTDVNGNGYNDAGDIINYSFTVTNTGNVTLSNVVVTDPLVTVAGGPITILSPGASNSTTFTATYVITAANVATGYVENTATTTGTTPTGGSVTDTSDAGDDATETGDGDGGTNGDTTDDPTVQPLFPNPSIQLYKAISNITDVNGNNLNDAGDIINYAFTVTNTGDVVLTNVTVSDPLVTVVGGPLASLAVGASNSTTFTATYIITAADIAVGYVENTATATGTTPTGGSVTDTSDAGDDTAETGDGDGDTNGNPTDDPTVQPLPLPSIQLYKYISSITDVNGNGYSDAGDIINYSFTVTNTGNVTLSNVVVTDPLVTVVGGPMTVLSPGASNSTTFTATYVITAADAALGYVDNTAVATGTSPTGGNVTDTSDAGNDTTETGDGDGDTNGDPTDDPTVAILTPPCTANVSDIPDEEICQGDVSANNALSFPLEAYSPSYGTAPFPASLYSLSYILTDAAGTILQVSNQGAPYNTVSNIPTFTYSGLAAGNYRVYEVIYATSQGPLTNASVGSNINTVSLTSGTCLDATFADLYVHPAPSVTSVTANSPICTGNDLLIDLQATNVTVNGVPGYPIVSYQWDVPVGPNVAAEDLIVPNVTLANAGLYTVTITDALGCSATTGTTVVVNPTPTLAAVQTNVSCNGGTNGTITVTPSPAGTYTYTWSAGGSTTNTATGLAAGTYTVTVSANGCSAVTSVTITQPNALLAAIINVAQPTCVAGVVSNNGAGTVSVSGGTSPYTYSWTGGATTATVSNLAPGNYSVTVTDFNNCTLVLTNALLLNAPNCCTANVSDIPDEEICQGNVAANNSLNFPLEPYNASYGPAPIPANLYSLSYILTTSTGTILQVSHQGAPYNAVSTIPIFTYSGLAAGNYRVYEVIYLTSEGPLTNATAGSSMNSVGLTTGSVCIDATFADLYVHPAPSVTSITANSPVCTGSDLLIDLQATNVTVNGVPGYPIASYQWDVPVGPNVIAEDVMVNNVTTANAGLYTVTITDALGCSATTSTTVVVNPTPTLAAVQTNVSCNGGTNGTITITPSPAGAYTYTWSAGGSTTNTATGLAAGTYTVTVSANGCSAVTSVTIIQPTALTASIINVAQPTCTAGVATNNGAGTASVSGGTAPYTYLWTGGATTATVSNLAPGNYSVTVTDFNNCTVVLTNALVLNTPDCCTANVSDIPDQEICQGYTGSLSFPLEAYSTIYGDAPVPAATYSLTYVLATSGGTILQFANMGAPYNTVSNTPAFTYSGLAAGNYRVYEIIWRTADGPLVGLTIGGNVAVVDVTNASSNCLDSTFGDLYINPTPLATADSNSPICAGEDLILVATGGTSYTWSGPASFGSTANFDAINNATSSNAGTYNVTVTDANGCTATDNTIVVVNTVTAAISSATTTSCSPITLTAVGTGTYTWSNGATTTSISASTSGIYTVTVTGAGGCTASALQAVTINSIQASIVPFGPTSFCQGGSVTLLATGGTSYLWDNGSTNAALTATANGTYTVTVTTANGCTAAVSQNVVVQSATAAITASGATTFCNGGTVDLTVLGTGTYLWNTGATTATISASSTNTYTVTVTNGSCTATAAQAVTVNSVAASITPFGPTEFCAGNSLTLLANGGVNYLWSNTASTPAITVTTSNTYTVTVTGSNNCTAAQSISITVNPLPAVNAGADVTICDGVTTQLGAPQIANMVYSWGPAGGLNATDIAQPMASPSTTTTYGLTMTNAVTGCTAIDNVLVTVNPTPTASASNNGPLCDTRDIILNATGGLGYQWSGPNGYTANTATATVLATNPLFPGPGSWTYYVTVSNGSCISTAATVVAVNDSPDIVPTSNSPVCIGNTVNLYANYSNNTATDIYSWTGPVSFSSNLPNPTISNSQSYNAGIYTLTVGNEWGCVTAANVSVGMSPLPNAAINKNVICNGNTGTINLSVASAGIGSTYQWSGTGALSNGTNQTISGVSSGNYTYTVTITNSNGCSATSSTQVSVSCAIACAAQAGSVSTGTVCPGEPIAATFTGNNTAYNTQVILTNTSGVIMYVGAAPIPAQVAGNYLLYSYNYLSEPTPSPAIGGSISSYASGANATGCYDVSNTGSSLTINGASPMLTGYASITQGNQGGTSPYAYNTETVTICGGILPYNYIWDNNGYVRYDILYTDVDCNNDGTIDGPGALITVIYADQATWAVTVTSSSNCGTATPVSFNNIPGGTNANTLLDIDSYNITGTPQTASTGAITIHVTGGVACAGNTYNYQWTGPANWTPAGGQPLVVNGGSANPTISGLPYGWYSVTVTDCGGNQTEGWYWVPAQRRGRTKTSDEPASGMTVYPNPLSQAATLDFYSAQGGYATVKLFAADGKEVKTLFEGITEAEKDYSLPIDATHLPSGVYIASLLTESGEVIYEKVVITK